MNISFDDPQRLLLSLAAIPLALVALRWFRSMILARRLSAIAARAVLLLLVASMLAGARRVRETELLAVIAVVDLSESVLRFSTTGLESSERVREFLQLATTDRGPDDLLGIVAFDGRSIAVASPSRADVLTRPLEPAGMVGTDLAGALRLAASMIPPDATGRIILFSDGNQTTGSALDTASELVANSTATARSPTPIDVIAFDYNVQDEVVFESLDAPPHAAGESTITLRAIFNSTSHTQGTLSLLREGEPVNIALSPAAGPSRRVTLTPGRSIQLLTVPLPSGRVHRFSAVFEPDPIDGGFLGDTTLVNNIASTFTLTPGRGSVLLVDGVSDGSPVGPGATLSRTLIEAGIDVQTIPPRAFPRDMLSLQPYDLILFQNVPADEIDDDQQRLLASSIRDLGAGFVMIGGPDAFGAGGWHNSTVEALLPIRMDLPDQLIAPEAAIVFVLDQSGSMAANVLGSMRSQQQIANEAAALAIRSLDKSDLVGVIAFNDAYRVIAPLAPNSNADQTAARVRAIAPGGGTTLGPALREAGRQLAAADARNKQIIVLTDGVSTDAGELPALAAQLSRQDIRVSTISVGDGADDAGLNQIASQGGGTFFAVVNPNALPRIFLKAVRVVRSPLLRERETSLIVPATGSPLTADLVDPPPLLGHVMARFRDDATITNAIISAEGEPIFSHWNVGLGQVGAFTSDAHRWAELWLEAPTYRQFWIQLARTAARVPADSNSELSVDVSGGMLSIGLDAFDRDLRPLDLLTVPATVFAPSGSSFEVTLAQKGPGSYQALVPVDAEGSYIVIARPRLGTSRLTPLLAGATLPAGAELARLSPDLGLLRQIAERTGGRVLSLDMAMDRASTPLLFDRSTVSPARTSRPIWPYLLAWALAVFLLDVGTRRIAWDRFISRRFGVDLRRDMREAVAARDVRAPELLLARRSHEREVSPVALTSQDAREAVADAKRRRAQAYERKIQEQRANRDQSHAAPIERDAQPPPSDDAPGDLLAAKRRARKRFEDQQP